MLLPFETLEPLCADIFFQISNPFSKSRIFKQLRYDEVSSFRRGGDLFLSISKLFADSFLVKPPAFSSNPICSLHSRILNSLANDLEVIPRLTSVESLNPFLSVFADPMAIHLSSTIKSFECK